MTGAQLDLSFRHHPGRGTYLDRRVFRWPYTISRTFRLDESPAGMLTLIVQTVSGAVQAGDALVQRLHVGAGAAVHVTTQGATAVHRAPPGQTAAESVELTVEADAVAEHLPEPRILFPDSSLSQTVRVSVAESATALLSDGFVLHDPEGRGRPFGRYEAELIIERPGRGVEARDRIDLDSMPRSAGRRAPLGAHGTLLIVTPLDAAALDALCRAIEHRLGEAAGIYAAASALPGDAGAVLRVAAADGRRLRLALSTGWMVARHRLFGREPAPRRKDGDAR